MSVQEHSAEKKIWLVLGDKVGDNAQAEIIAKALGRPYQIKRVRPVEKFVFGKPGFKPSLYHIDKANSDPLEPPWPDLIVTVGRRSSMVALWIKQQSGNRSKIVLLGRPRRWLEQFDLVVSPIQYRVPVRDNVYHLGLPLIQPDSDRIDAAKQEWEAKLAHLAKPIVALLIGGPTRPFVLDQKVAASLLARAAEITAQRGGTLYITTSRRTPAKVVETIEAQLPPGAILYRWGDASEDNPYLGLLSLAGLFIVTGDSVSMMVEVARLGKPLAICPLPSRWWGHIWQKITTRLHPTVHGEHSDSFLEPLGAILYRLGWVGYSRDLTMVHRYLMDAGLATELGQPLPRANAPIPDELGKVTALVQQLLVD